MNRKIVFFDIDGTIWDWTRIIPESTREAIAGMREKGHLAFICSGRARGNIRDPRLLSMGFDGIVAACGTYIELEGRIVHNRLVEPELVKKTVEVMNRARMPFVLEGPQKHWVSDWGFDADDYVTNLYRIMKDDAVTMHDYTEGIEINKFSADVLRQTDYPYVREQLDGDYDFIEHGVTPDVLQEPAGDEDPLEIISVIEAVPKGCSKGEGLMHVCSLLGIPPEDTFAVGDSVNDLEMFEAAGVAIAMGNATEAAKKAADWVTSDITDGGIMKAMEHFGLV